MMCTSLHTSTGSIQYTQLPAHGQLMAERFLTCTLHLSQYLDCRFPRPFPFPIRYHQDCNSVETHERAFGAACDLLGNTQAAASGSRPDCSSRHTASVRDCMHPAYVAPDAALLPRRPGGPTPGAAGQRITLPQDTNTQ